MLWVDSCCSQLRIVLRNDLFDFVKANFLGKIWFFSYDPECPQPIRLQDPLIINICGRNQLVC